MELFSTCPICTADTHGIVEKEQGTALHIHQHCSSCGYMRKWKNQPYIRNMPVLNLLMSGAILFSGTLPSKAMRLFTLLGLMHVRRRTYFRHQRLYLEPVVYSTWEEQQKALFSNLRDDKVELELAGDGRSDSPGYCAKYGTYTLIEMNTNKILDMKIIQVCHFPNILAILIFR